MEYMENPFETILSFLDRLEARIERLENSIKEMRMNSGEIDEVGGVDFAVKLTGYSKSTIYVMTSKNKIPFTKRGSRNFFSKKDLTAWMLENKQSTVKEINDAA